MVKFSYKGVDAGQKSVSGVVDANDRKTAILQLKSNGISVNSLDEFVEGKEKRSPFSISFKVAKSKSKVALNFLKKFLQLYAGGLAIGDAIRIMRLRLKEPQEKILAESIYKDVCEGKTIANAMRNFPDIFNENTVCMIEAGERTGNLAPVIKNLIEFLETKENIKKKFIKGMAYPAAVCIIGFLVGVVFLVFVLPRLEKMLKSLNAGLPAIAKMLIRISDFSIQYWWVVLIGAVVAFASFVSYRKTEKGKYNIDKWSLKIPIIGLIIRENFYCQTSNLLSTLLGSGINTTEAMTLAENASSNMYFKTNFIEAKKMVLDGMSITQAFELKEVFPDLALDLLSVGENTGNLDTPFREIFKIYHTSLLENLSLMTSAITAIAMGLSFAGVSVLAFSVITSVLKVTTSIKM